MTDDAALPEDAARASIWLLDDSATQRELMARALGERFAIAMFEDGATMLSELATVRTLPDLLLIDWVMPGMSGDEVCRFVRSTSRAHELPIIMMTASRIGLGDAVHALESGANDYVAKPFVAAELRARVAGLIRVNQLRRAAEVARGRIEMVNAVSSELLRAAMPAEPVLERVARALVRSFCDGVAAITVASNTVLGWHRATGGELVRQFAALQLPMLSTFATARDASSALPEASAYVAELGLCSIVRLPIVVRATVFAELTLVRDGGTDPFDAADVEALQTCLTYVGVALDALAKHDAERVTMRFHEQMAAIVGHDLRTPLAAIALGVGLLREESIDPSTSMRVLERLERSTHRASRIVDLLLDVTRSRLGSGIPLAPAFVNLNRVVGDVIEETRSARPEARIEYRGSDVEGIWDGDRLGQVVSTSSATRSSTGGPAVMSVSSSRALPKAHDCPYTTITSPSPSPPSYSLRCSIRSPAGPRPSMSEDLAWACTSPTRSFAGMGAS